ncbi:MAG: DUF1599 domain-containing protein [Bacteroidia bacterium]|nr:DUF1599 domain-containing protein [Bacteroidia bacterium]
MLNEIISVNTTEQFDTEAASCKDIFIKKMSDYGNAWRVLRVSSLTDQVFIKAQRIRTIEETGEQLVEDGITSEFMGIVNYAVIALIQLELGSLNVQNIPVMEPDAVLAHFDKHIAEARVLMTNKNHDYGEAWRKMRTSSFTDLILMKLLRVRQIEDHDGKTIASEGIAANFYDIINYAIFALIKLSESKTEN